MCMPFLKFAHSEYFAPIKKGHANCVTFFLNMSFALIAGF